MLKVGATLCQVELEGSEVEETTTSRGTTAASSSSTDVQDSSTTKGSTTTKQFKLADIGEGITECEVVKW